MSPRACTLPPVLSQASPQCFQEELAIRVGPEDLLTTVTTIEDMIDSSWELQTRSASHPLLCSSLMPPVQPFESDVDFHRLIPLADEDWQGANKLAADFKLTSP